MNPDSLRVLPFFTNATFFRHDSMRNQGWTNCCNAFVLVDMMFAKQILAGSPGSKGSELELMDMLHLIYPDYSAKYDENHKIIVDKKGLLNSYVNACNYIQNYGLSLEINYPYIGTCIPRAWPADKPRFIYTGPTCYEVEALDRGFEFGYHAILVMGYGDEGNQPYYVVKNSWGEDWGYMGYAKINAALLDEGDWTSPYTPTVRSIV